MIIIPADILNWIELFSKNFPINVAVAPKNINTIENVVFGNILNGKWKYKTDISDNYTNLQIISLTGGEEVYLWEYNGYTFLNVTKELLNIYYKEFSYCLK